MEDLMPELVELVLSQVNHLGMVACRFVCSTWRHATPLQNQQDHSNQLFWASAAKGGHLAVLQWARANGAPWGGVTCAKAARGGRLEVLQWARANGCPWDTSTCAYAAKGGHLEVLQWARANGCPWYKQTCTNAAGGGHLSVLQWARANGCPWGKRTCAIAAGEGHLEVLRWARANGCPWDEWTCANAAKGGHLEVLKWARANGCPWDLVTCAYAARGGHLAVLQWARADGCPWSEWTCAAAAEGGHLEVLQWARVNGCQWDKRTCAAAARGHLEVLQWARANGCPWGKRTCTNAAKGGHLAVLQWVRANGCPWDKATCSSAAKGGHLKVLQWARANGCPWDEETCVLADVKGHVKRLELPHGLPQRTCHQPTLPPESPWPDGLQTVRLVVSALPALCTHHSLAPALYANLNEQALDEACPFELPGLYLEATYTAAAAHGDSAASEDDAALRQRRGRALCALLDGALGLDLGPCDGHHNLQHMGRLPPTASLSNLATHQIDADVFLGFGATSRSQLAAVGPWRYYLHALDFSWDRAAALLANLHFASVPLAAWDVTGLEVRLAPGQSLTAPFAVDATLLKSAPAVTSAAELRFELAEARPDELAVVTTASDQTELMVVSNWRRSADERQPADAALVTGTLHNFTRALVHNSGPPAAEFHSMRRSLDKQGFHRDLRTEFVLSLAASHAPAGSGPLVCAVAAVEILPETVFVDQYQTTEILRFGGPIVLVFDEFDLEKPSSDPGAHQGMVVVHDLLASFLRVGDGRREADVSLVLPLHLRYQEPATNATHRAVVLAPPLVYYRCSVSNGSSSVLSQYARWTRVAPRQGDDHFDSGAPLWVEMRVPVGQAQTQGLVTLVTLLATTLGALVVLVFLCASNSDNKRLTRPHAE